MVFMMGGQGSSHRYLIYKPWQCHATYNLLFELKLHCNKSYYIWATVTRLANWISAAQNPWRATIDHPELIQIKGSRCHNLLVDNQRKATVACIINNLWHRTKERVPRKAETNEYHSYTYAL